MALKIVVIEDDEDVRDFVEAYLSDKGYQVSHAPNARDGWGKIQEIQPELVILDIMMPGLDGIQLLKIINDSQKIRIPKVLILTAVQEVASVEEAMGLGACGYLLKPVDGQRLLRKVQDLIG